jgi:hypothetical protein
MAPVPFVVTSIFPFAPSAKVIFPAFVPLFVFKIKSPVPCVVIVALASVSPTEIESAARTTSPVPLGVILILASAPSSIVIFPEFVPLFVFKIKSPVPCVVIVALASLSPT